MQAAAGAPRAAKGVALPAKGVGQCSALHAYEAKAAHELSLSAGDVVTLIRKHPSGWWEGVAPSGAKGWFPSTFVGDVGDVPAPPPPQPKAAVATEVAPEQAAPASQHGDAGVAPAPASRAAPLEEHAGAFTVAGAVVEQAVEAGGAGWEGPGEVAEPKRVSLTLDCSPLSASVSALLARGEGGSEGQGADGAGRAAGEAQGAAGGDAVTSDVPGEGGVAGAQRDSQEAGGGGQEGGQEAAASGPGDDGVDQAGAVMGDGESAAQDLPAGAGDSADVGAIACEDSADIGAIGLASDLVASAGAGETGGEDAVGMEGGEGGGGVGGEKDEEGPGVVGGSAASLESAGPLV